ncbi:hypothetical protein B0H15DRAFT_158776 [Mycena belliarum]|uniref:Uncharacterized protein n=1 Tax=Mycena belliarum TaxID=1033014 RepID=A0AAD6TTY7_9AGAR|nr:hypothetical protein B0H15DRAFT_517810 [Mycena belliae]KAJ7093445.1 hypothetical protein B0H15DRAFT_158776 [Mycena belliae]
MKVAPSLSSVLTTLLAGKAVEAAFNCSMNIDVNSRACAALTCAVTGRYLAGQIVAFDCINAGSQTVAGSVYVHRPLHNKVYISSNRWWGRDPLKHFVPIGDMTGVDGLRCDTHLGLCASLPPS